MYVSVDLELSAYRHCIVIKLRKIGIVWIREPNGLHSLWDWDTELKTFKQDVRVCSAED